MLSPLRALAALLILAAGPAHATDSPFSGEAVLARDIEVRETPDAASRIVRTLPKGATVTALGAPRGSALVQIGIGGRAVGYVPFEVLTSIYGPRAVSGTAAVVSRQRWAPDGRLDGSHVVARATGGTEIRDAKRKETKLHPGQVLSLLDFRNGKARLASATIASITVDAAALLPIIGVHDYGDAVGDSRPVFHIARLGDFPSPADAAAAWNALLLTFPHYADHHPFVFPTLGQTVRFSLAFGPLDRTEADNACMALAQRQLDCWVWEVLAF